MLTMTNPAWALLTSADHKGEVTRCHNSIVDHIGAIHNDDRAGIDGHGAGQVPNVGRFAAAAVDGPAEARLRRWWRRVSSAFCRAGWRQGRSDLPRRSRTRPRPRPRRTPWSP